MVGWVGPCRRDSDREVRTIVAVVAVTGAFFAVLVGGGRVLGIWDVEPTASSSRQSGQVRHGQDKSKQPDPKPLTLEGKDLRLRTSRAREGYFRVPGVRAYLREYDVLGGRLGGSKVIYLRTMTEVFASAQTASGDQKYLASGKGSRSITRGFLRELFRGSGFSPTNVEARPLNWRGADTAAFQFFFDVPRGRIEGLMLSVSRGRVRGSVTVYGFDQDVDPAAVLVVREKLRARLEA